MGSYYQELMSRILKIPINNGEVKADTSGIHPHLRPSVAQVKNVTVCVFVSICIHTRSINKYMNTFDHLLWPSLEPQPWRWSIGAGISPINSKSANWRENRRRIEKGQQRCAPLPPCTPPSLSLTQLHPSLLTLLYRPLDQYRLKKHEASSNAQSFDSANVFATLCSPFM